MTRTFCFRLGLVAMLVVLWGPAQTAQAQSKARARLMRYEWEGSGRSRGGSALSLELKFAHRATRASLSLYWSQYQTYTARGTRVSVGTLANGKGLKIKDRFADTHPIYHYKSSTGIYCHIPSRELLRSNQFRCKLLYSGWIVMHRKGIAPKPMASRPPARPPSLKGRPPARPAAVKGSPGARSHGPGRPVSRGRVRSSVVGCWMKSVLRSGTRQIVRSLLLTNKGRFRWIQGRRQRISRGRYVTTGSSILLLDPARTRGTRWRFTLTRCMPRRPFQPCLRLYQPQAIRRTRRGKIVKRGRAGTRSHLFMRVGTRPSCR